MTPKERLLLKDAELALRQIEQLIKDGHIVAQYHESYDKCTYWRAKAIETQQNIKRHLEETASATHH